MSFNRLLDITFRDMCDYIEREAPEAKAWFKAVSTEPDGVYHHVKARRAFCARFMPELLKPTKSAKSKASDVLKDW